MLSDNVIVALIVTFGTIITGLLGYLGITAGITRRHARAASNNTAETRDEVKNSHTVNLRDDLDEKFENLARMVGAVILDVGGMRSDMRSIRQEALVDRQAAAADRSHIHELEQTLTPAQLRTLNRKD